MEQDKIIEEYKAMLKLIKELEAILENPKLVDQIVIDELKTFKSHSEHHEKPKSRVFYKSFRTKIWLKKKRWS